MSIDLPARRRHHFTRFDQVNQLVGASEADPDMGFIARLLAGTVKLTGFLEVPLIDMPAKSLIFCPD